MNHRRQDTEFCGRVPLNQTNLIQPHGILIVLKKPDFTIIQVSENIASLFDEEPSSVVNKLIGAYLPQEQVAILKERSETERTDRLPFSFTIGKKPCLSLLHTRNEYVIMEVEIKQDDYRSPEFITLYQDLKLVMASVDAAITTSEACASAIRELKRLTGFDKIMVYQFDDDWNGTVIAEMAEKNMESYLGLRFPPTDIPKQARDLYLKNPYRFIPNVDYIPVKLFPLLNPVTNAFMDLSDTNLRSVAGVHLEYLNNMGVKSSMSTRILLDGRLWGLIACHHRKAKFLSYENCFIFELVSNILSAKIASLQKADSNRYRDELHQTYNRLVDRIYLGKKLSSVLQEQQGDLLDLLKAEGAALIANKQVFLYGETPSREDVENLAFWLRSNNIQKLYSEENLPGNYVEAENFAKVASGLMVLPIQPDTGMYLMAFRPEAIQSIDWGGNPNEAITFEADRKNYHPRHSFKLWQETVQQTSRPWKEEEREVAERFRNFLVEYILTKS